MTKRFICVFMIYVIIKRLHGLCSSYRIRVPLSGIVCGVVGYVGRFYDVGRLRVFDAPTPVVIPSERRGPPDLHTFRDAIVFPEGVHQPGNDGVVYRCGRAVCILDDPAGFLKLPDSACDTIKHGIAQQSVGQGFDAGVAGFRRGEVCISRVGQAIAGDAEHGGRWGEIEEGGRLPDLYASEEAVRPARVEVVAGRFGARNPFNLHAGKTVMPDDGRFGFGASQA